MNSLQKKGEDPKNEAEVTPKNIELLNKMTELMEKQVELLENLNTKNEK
jgi:large conductance mechanosensitive channel